MRCLPGRQRILLIDETTAARYNKNAILSHMKGWLFMDYQLLKNDPQLQPFAGDIALRMENYNKAKHTLLKPGQTLKDFANAHHYFGFHRTETGWYYREWAPANRRFLQLGSVCPSPGKAGRRRMGAFFARGCTDAGQPGHGCGGKRG